MTTKLKWFLSLKRGMGASSIPGFELDEVHPWTRRFHVVRSLGIIRAARWNLGMAGNNRVWERGWEARPSRDNSLRWDTSPHGDTNTCRDSIHTRTPWDGQRDTSPSHCAGTIVHRDKGTWTHVGELGQARLGWDKRVPQVGGLPKIFVCHIIHLDLREGGAYRIP
jgi:hypothetical protein